MLNDEVPLIGFCRFAMDYYVYAVEGQGSKSFDKAKGFCFLTQKQHMFYCKKITDTTILYLKEKSKIGSRCRSNF
jgi:uroporphyrinogen decarboxylase